MPLEKQSLNNFLPNGFETLNQEGYKENFSADKIATGYEKDVPDIVSGPNLNNLIDVVGKNTNTLNNYVEYLNGMPINNVPTVNANGQLDYTNLDDKLTKKQITNCILEIPQRIKFELNNSTTMTLKAGSILIIPNGFEEDGVTPKFEDKLVENDISFTFTPNKTGKCLVELSPNNEIAFSAGDNSIQYYYSGGTQPTIPSSTVYGHWYDTTNNIMKYTSDSGKTWQEGFTLPFAEMGYVSTGSITGLRALNGMGYIGSTIWVDKGVKCLRPNGRNEDGSLKNTEFTVDKLMTRTFDTTENVVLAISVNYISKTSAVAYTYKEIENINYSGSDVWNHCVIGSSTLTNGIISNFNPKQPFRAIDYSDKSEISAWGMPSNKYIDLTLGASATTYTAPANGWMFFQKRCTTTASCYISLTYANKRGGVYSANNLSHSMGIMLPVLKGDVVRVSYQKASGSWDTDADRFAFIYAEGEV